MRHGTSGRRNRNRGNGGGRRNNNNQRTQVYDSNGPDVRIRGTAHQVAEKYLSLAKDATSAGNDVIAENYYQHAEHYIRIIGEQNGSFDAHKILGTKAPYDVSDDEGNKSTDAAPEQKSKAKDKDKKVQDDLSLPASIVGKKVDVKEKVAEPSGESVD